MSFDAKEPLMRYEINASSGVWPLQRRPTNNPAYEDDDDNEPMRTHAFPRAMTEPLAHAINLFTDDDGEWTRELIENFDVIDDKGPDGEVPMQPAFAQDRGFWEILIIGIFMGGFTGLVALGFMNVIDEVPKRWVNNGEFNEVNDCGYYDGNPYWIIVVGSAGFLVGTLRWLFSFPNDLPGFFKEVTSCHVDYMHAPQTLLLSAISIAGGASLGPEQAMGNVGGGLATLIAEKMEFEEEHSKLTVLTGMAAAMGGIFPSPVLGVLMIHELGNPPKSFMESTLLMSIGAIASFIVFYMLEDYTYLESLSPNYLLSMDWEFETKHCGVAVVIGALSSVIALMTLLTVGITKQVFYRIEERCNKVGLPGKIIVCTIGGICIGTVNWALPLTVGNGHLTLSALLEQRQHLSTGLLLSTGFARMFTLGCSMNCGFVGGFIYPMITIGFIVGVIAHQRYEDELPIGMTVTCFLAAVPSGICPMPFTFLGISCLVFFLGLQQTVPVFISCIVAYTLFTGIGIFGALQSRGEKKNEGDVVSDSKKYDPDSEPVNKYNVKTGRGSLTNQK